MEPLAEQSVRARDGERATKDSSKGGTDEVLSQIATHELGMPTAKWPKRQLTRRKQEHHYDRN